VPQSNALPPAPCPAEPVQAQALPVPQTAAAASPSAKPKRRQGHHVTFSQSDSSVEVPGPCFGAERAVPEATSWNDLAQASYYRRLPQSLGPGLTAKRRWWQCSKGTAASATTWPVLHPGEQNVLFVSLINERSLPAFRVHVAVVRSEDAVEICAVLLGSALVLSPLPFPDLARLGQRQNEALDHANAVRRAEEDLADAEAVSLGLRAPSTPTRHSLGNAVRRKSAGSEGDSTTVSSVEDAKQALEVLVRSAPLELTTEELQSGFEAAASIHQQACCIMKCAYDAIVSTGLVRAVAMFAKGCELRESRSSDAYTVHGCKAHTPRFSCFGVAEDVTWSYAPPLSDEDGGANARGGAREYVFS
jgi:hypothetical protein